jgi:hypothetical protein
VYAGGCGAGKDIAHDESTALPKNFTLERIFE